MGQGEKAPVSRASGAGLTDIVRVEPEGAARWEGGGVMSSVHTSFLNDQLTVLQVKQTSNLLVTRYESQLR